MDPHNITYRDVFCFGDDFRDYYEELLETPYTTESTEFKQAMKDFKHGIEILTSTLHDINTFIDDMDKRTNAYRTMKTNKEWVLYTIKYLNDCLVEIVDNAK